MTNAQTLTVDAFRRANLGAVQAAGQQICTSTGDDGLVNIYPVGPCRWEDWAFEVGLGGELVELYLEQSAPIVAWTSKQLFALNNKLTAEEAELVAYLPAGYAEWFIDLLDGAALLNCSNKGWTMRQFDQDYEAFEAASSGIETFLAERPIQALDEAHQQGLSQILHTYGGK